MTHVRKSVFQILSTESDTFLVVRVLHEWQLIAVSKIILLRNDSFTIAAHKQQS